MVCEHMAVLVCFIYLYLFFQLILQCVVIANCKHVWDNFTVLESNQTKTRLWRKRPDFGRFPGGKKGFLLCHSDARLHLANMTVWGLSHRHLFHLLLPESQFASCAAHLMRQLFAVVSFLCLLWLKTETCNSKHLQF